MTKLTTDDRVIETPRDTSESTRDTTRERGDTPHRHTVKDISREEEEVGTLASSLRYLLKVWELPYVLTYILCIYIAYEWCLLMSHHS
jgi:hypothetical protein